MNTTGAFGLNRVLWLIVAVLSLAMGCSTGGSSTQIEVLSGQVVDASNWTPMSDVLVKAGGKETITDQTGLFSFRGLQNMVQLEIQKDGFLFLPHSPTIPVSSTNIEIHGFYSNNTHQPANGQDYIAFLGAVLFDLRASGYGNTDHVYAERIQNAPIPNTLTALADPVDVHVASMSYPDNHVMLGFPHASSASAASNNTKPAVMQWDGETNVWWAVPIEQNDGYYWGRVQRSGVYGLFSAYATEPPSVDPPRGTISAGSPIQLQAADDAIIYYTLDGSKPNHSSDHGIGQVELVLEGHTDLRAIAQEPNHLPSREIRHMYIYDPIEPIAPPSVPTGFVGQYGRTWAGGNDCYAQLNWNPNPASEQVLYYTIYLNDGPGFWPRWDVNSQGTNMNQDELYELFHRGLALRSVYQYKLTATNRVGRSSATEPITVVMGNNYPPKAPE